jgi:hypothetical protein
MPIAWAGRQNLSEITQTEYGYHVKYEVVQVYREREREREEKKERYSDSLGESPAARALSLPHPSKKRCVPPLNLMSGIDKEGGGWR